MIEKLYYLCTCMLYKIQLKILKKTNMNDKHTSSYVHVDIKICNEVVKILSYPLKNETLNKLLLS